MPTSFSRRAFLGVAIAWPPQRAPLVLAVYMSDSESSVAELSEAQAHIGRIVAAQLIGDNTATG